MTDTTVTLFRTTLLRVPWSKDPTIRIPITVV